MRTAELQACVTFSILLLYVLDGDAVFALRHAGIIIIVPSLYSHTIKS